MVEEGQGSSGDGGLGSSGVPSQAVSGARADGGADTLAAMLAEERRAGDFTAGPWFTGPTPSYLDAGQSKEPHGRTITIRSPAHTEEICTVWTYLLPQEANARLIAAAPRMAYIIDYIATHSSQSDLRGLAREVLAEAGAYQGEVIDGDVQKVSAKALGTPTASHADKGAI